MWKHASLILALAACGAFPRPPDLVACTPGQFAQCRGDTELICNTAGTDYDAVSCGRGCEPTIGCRLCDANQTVCTNGKVQRCDATGTVTSSEACPLGCFEDQPRCREIDPSNGLATYLDVAATGQDLVLDRAVLEIPTGIVVSPIGQFQLHGTLVPASPGGAPIEVFALRSLTVKGDLSIQANGVVTTPAVAFIVYGDVEIDGSIRLVVTSYDEAPPPGSMTSGDCVGAPGKRDAGGTSFYISGGGGGGGAMQGGAGGSQLIAGGTGGAAFSNPDLQPLRGGCAGGTPAGYVAGHGGGAIQITSRSSIRLATNSSIEANGYVGRTEMLAGIPGDEAIPRGGGSGGGILLEAPVVRFDASVALAANGAGGSSGDGMPATVPSGRLPSTGGRCRAANSNPCSGGGDGGSVYGPGGTAASIAFTGQQEIDTGAGGGSVGTIRINTASGTYIKANDVFESPTPSVGTIATR